MKPQVEWEPPSSSKKRVTATVKLGEWRYPVFLYMGDVYDLGVALRLGEEGKGWPGVFPEHPVSL